MKADEMTRKVFWSEPYRPTLNTTIDGVDGSDVTLAETIFYALSGGQESDHGTIAGRPVREARKAGQGIIYALDEGHGLRPGDPVEIRIDGPRRHRLMRLHFAAEIVLELVTRALPEVVKIGAHISADKARIDLDWPMPITPALPDLAAQANALALADRPIVSGFADPAGERRYWEIDGFARVPCGGTHLRRTGEIGVIALKRKNIGRAKERIEIFVDERPVDPALLAQ